MIDGVLLAAIASYLEVFATANSLKNVSRSES